MELIARLREKFLIGCHYNWHPITEPVDDRFDYHFALQQDLAVTGPARGPLLEMDACNFTPSYFRPGPEVDRPIDVLVVARAVYFKRPELALRVLRQLAMADPTLRIYALLAVPPEEKHHLLRETDKLGANVRSISGQGSEVDEGLNLDITSANYPFPRSRSDLAELFGRSKVFAQFTSVEYRSRTTSYAFCAGAKVVGRPNVGQLIPPELRHDGLFTAIRDDEDYPAAILSAVRNQAPTDVQAIQQAFRADATVPRLRSRVAGLLRAAPGDVCWTSDLDLDLRLGRHVRREADPNSISGDLTAFLEELVSADESGLHLRVASKTGLEVEESIIV